MDERNGRWDGTVRLNQLWKLVNLLKWCKATKNKWVFKIKCKANDTIEKYKAKLVAKGHTQQEGIDYEESFTLIIRFISISLILAIIASMDLELHQMNVKIALFNEDLEEKIYT